MIFVANHSSHLDTPLILLSLPDEWRRQTAVAAAADYFFDTWWRAVGSAMVFNTFPIERRGGSLATTPGELLAEGWSVVVFPEGTRSPDGWIGRFRLGAAYLACQHGVPVVPVAHRGSFAAMPRGRGWPVPGPSPAQRAVRRAAAPRGGRVAARLRAQDPRRRRPRCSTRTRPPGGRPGAGAPSGATPDPAGPEIAHWRRVWEQTTPWSPTPSRRRSVPGSGDYRVARPG